MHDTLRSYDDNAVQDRQVVTEFLRRIAEKPVRMFIPHSQAQQIALSSAIRGTLLIGGGNQSGKTVIGLGKCGSIADGYHGEVMCPRDCLQWGAGSCGAHGCPGYENGGTTSCEAYGRPVYCDVHRPLTSNLPRELAIIGDSYEHIYDLMYRKTLFEMLCKNISGSIRWSEPSKDRGKHFIAAHDGSYHIEFISMAQGGKRELRGKRKLFFYVDELPPYDAYRELMMRILRFGGQIMIGATHDQLLDSKVQGQWIFKEIIERKSPRIQWVSISTRDNPVIDQSDLEDQAALMSPEEREIRIEGKFGYKSSRCVFSQFTLDRQKLNAEEPKVYYLNGCFPPRAGTDEWEEYFAGPTRFPQGCNLEPVRKQVLVSDRMQSGRGGVACINCPAICHLYQAPPMNRSVFSLNPELLDRRYRDLVTGDETPAVEIFELPVPGGIYIAGSDMAKGRKGGDFSTFPIFNAMTGDQVACVNLRIRTLDFAFMTAGLIQLYNNCFVVPEANPPGDEVILIWTEMLGIRNLYVDPVRKVTLPSGESAPFVGFLTLQDTKRHQLIRKLEQLAVSNVIKIKHAETIRQMGNFINDGGKLGAIEGDHDDLVVGTGLVAVGWEMVSRRALMNPGLPDCEFEPESAAAAEKKYFESVNRTFESYGASFNRQYIDD